MAEEQVSEETYGAVQDSGGAVWRQYAYGIWKPEVIPDGQSRIKACGFRTLDAFYGPVKWMETS